MSTNSFEEPIGFHLIKVKGAVKTAKESYRAVLSHNGLNARATLEELVKETNIPEYQLRYFGTTILNALISNTLKDGRSRNFEGFMTTRLDISGSFNRIDEPFDPTKHTCVLSFSPGPNAAVYHRRSAPINGTKPPRGRFDYITYPGGEKTFVKLGEPIEVYGHDLKLDKQTNFISLRTYDKDGRAGYYTTVVAGRENPSPYDAKLLYNSDTLLRIDWPVSWTPEKLRGQTTLKLHFFDGGEKERHDSFSRCATILA